MSPVAGWYADPSSSDRLRWWDGVGWTNDTRDRQAHRAPPPPGAGSPSAPPPPPPATPPWPGSSTGSPPTGSGGYAAPGSGTYGFGPGSTSDSGQFGYGGAYSTPSAATTAPVPAAESNRAWLSWASIGAAIAVALAVIIILSVSLLGHTSKPSASQGLSATTTEPAGTSTSTAPTTSVLPPPPDSQPFTDPGGVYSIAINPAWQVPATTTGGIAQWYLTGVNYGGFRSNLDIVTQNLPTGEPLASYVQANEQQLTRTSGFHLQATTNITLTDGTPATVIAYATSAYGQSIQGEAILTVKGSHAVAITVLAAANAAGSTFALVDPYIQTLHLN